MAKVMCITEGRRLRRREPRRLTPETLAELLAVHALCLNDQSGKCPLMVSLKSLCWEVNQFMNVTNEEDRGFKRHDPMCAARTLNRVFECLLEERDDERDE